MLAKMNAARRRCRAGVRVAAVAILAAGVAVHPAGGQAPPDLLERRLPTPGPSKVLRSTLERVAAAEVPLRPPEGFRVELFAEGLSMPRELAVLPAGDVLVAESAAGRIARLRRPAAAGGPVRVEVWAETPAQPYGLLVRDGFVYAACNQAIVRFPLRSGDAAGPRETVIEPIAFDGETFPGGHWTRDILFSRDGSKLYVSVGSRSNNDDDEPPGRAAILEYAADRSRPRLYATGLRNPVSLALRPGSDEIWVTVNERDRLGNDLVPDFVTSVRPGGFYGWPYSYIGAHPDPRHAGKRPDLVARAIVPDILIQSHSAALGLAFNEGSSFPAEYRGGLFVALHGSWNRDPLTGFAVVWIPFRDGRPAGGPRDFLTGFIADAERGVVYGRPVAPLFLPDGSLLVSDDGAGRVWRVTAQKP